MALKQNPHARTGEREAISKCPLNHCEALFPSFATPEEAREHLERAHGVPFSENVTFPKEGGVGFELIPHDPEDNCQKGMVHAPGPLWEFEYGGAIVFRCACRFCKIELATEMDRCGGDSR